MLAECLFEHEQAAAARRRPLCRSFKQRFHRVICATSSLPFVSGLNSNVMTNTTAAPDVAISIGMAKPSGWPKAK